MANLKAAIQRIATAGLILSSVPVYALSSGNENQVYEVPIEKLERFLKDNITTDFSGSILIAQNGRVIHAKGYGLANKEDNIPNKLDTVFATGGLTHYFTATAVLKLVEQNKLSLDDRLSEFFDNVPDNRQDITIHHLLTHTSGLIREEDLDAYEQIDEDAFLKDVFSRENSVDPAIYLPTFTFKPGDRVIRFSEGYNLLALIVEKRAGQPFETFLNDHLFKPAGIKNTGYQMPDWKPEQIANGYQTEDDKNWGNLADRLANKDKLPLYLQGSIGIMSTVEDIYAWHQALHAGKILRKDLLQLLNMHHIAVATSGEADIDYGYGISLTETWAGTPWLSNLVSSIAKRNLPGFAARYHYLSDEDIVVIYGSNREVKREFSDTINKLVRILSEPNYDPNPNKSPNTQ
ncbi:serine hydrolase [Kordiimonas sp. SCSIO 12610]|uniref:serine hydrolase domain-containing protein n=1 Tax=Kordiimonas sp. SCSIO 12610 TaxID=2829597 RepID=UPI00210EA0A4|nr:serine hydrolase domain-containing protein [Kordiimonas sp. SCSIO 12610]UTW55657.1 beta-lactamase family protein [Kordiimonas sp. SCSIO 12610]